MLMAGCHRPSSSREYTYLLLVFNTLQVVNVTYVNSALCLYIKKYGMKGSYMSAFDLRHPLSDWVIWRSCLATEHHIQIISIGELNLMVRR